MEHRVGKSWWGGGGDSGSGGGGGDNAVGLGPAWAKDIQRRNNSFFSQNITPGKYFLQAPRSRIKGGMLLRLDFYAGSSFKAWLGWYKIVGCYDDDEDEDDDDCDDD
ncbi:hypothetical protein M0802_001020 [Mischocyttarus mexicanus]|nr:hypothetical protein M0802_001020 [Mischocyttarus mexicanus]